MAGDRKRKTLSAREKDFARILAETGLGAIEAYRKAFSARCENIKDKQRARDLARSERVKNEVLKLRSKLEREARADQFMSSMSVIDVDRMQDFIIRQLKQIRDDPNPSVKAATKFNAIKLLEQMYDPTSDESLILRWINYAWSYQEVHCPCCHKSFPLAEIRNKVLEQWKDRNGLETVITNIPADPLNRRLQLIKELDPRNRPHASQTPAIEAEERHVVGRGPARAGKSYLLGLMAVITFLLPGVEIWLLARIYDNARHEVNYIRKFLNALFYPYKDELISEYFDRKTGELSMVSKWGSEIRVRSAKAKGSITGSALELALIAEPAWVEGDIYEELRARMSERLGRIFAFGTPKGTAGFLGRMLRTYGRDPKTGQFIRKQPHERLIRNGCPWNVSLLEYKVIASDNPAYVKSEAGAARQELTDVEYASEFAGEISSVEGAKFGSVKEEHLTLVPRSFFEEAAFVLGIDQGQTNFAAVLVAYDGKTIVPCWEYYNGKDTDSIFKNLLKLREKVPLWIKKLGGNPNAWKLTIFDQDPPVQGTLVDMADRGVKWPTEVTFRHRNNIKYMQNWRRETQEFVNNMAMKDRLIFHQSSEYNSDPDESPGAALLHDQVRNTLDVEANPEAESKSDHKKGWIVNDPWRHDHVLDAWYLPMWTILSNQFEVEAVEDVLDGNDPWAEYKAAFDYSRAVDEQRELSGFVDQRERFGERELFKKHFKRPSPYRGFQPLHYQDEG